MSHASATAARRGALLGLVPLGFVTVHYVLFDVVTVFDRPSRLSLLDLLVPAATLSALPVSLWCGKREVDRGGERRRCLVAGAMAGMVGVALVNIVQSGLTVIDTAFGITAFFWGLQGRPSDRERHDRFRAPADPHCRVPAGQRRHHPFGWPRRRGPGRAGDAAV